MIKAFLITIGYVFVASAQSFLSINEERFLQVTGNINAPCKLSTTGETCTDKGFCCATVTGFDQDRVTLVPSTTSGTCVPAEFDGVQIRTMLNGWYTPTCSFRATVTNYMSALGSQCTANSQCSSGQCCADRYLRFSDDFNKANNAYCITGDTTNQKSQTQVVATYTTTALAPWGTLGGTITTNCKLTPAPAPAPAPASTTTTSTTTSSGTSPTATPTSTPTSPTGTPPSTPTTPPSTTPTTAKTSFGIYLQISVTVLAAATVSFF